MTAAMDNRPTLQVCPACEGEGRHFICLGWKGGRWSVDPPEPYGYTEPCEECGGTGGALVPCWPVECDDLEPLIPVSLSGGTT